MAKQYTVTLTLPDGKRKYFRGNTRKEAEAKRDEAKLALASGIDVGDNTTVKEFAELWLRDYKKGVVRESTYNTLNRVVNFYIVGQIGNLKLKDTKPVHIQRILGAMSGNAKSTQAMVLRTTKEMFGVAVDNGLMLKNPCIKSIRPRGEERADKVPLTPEQSELLLEKAKGTNMYMFVLLGLTTGLRRGELLGLQWSDIDFDAGTLTVNRSVAPIDENHNGAISYDLKTEAAHRTIPLPWSVVNELRAAMRASRSVYIIPGVGGSFLKLTTVQHRWQRLLKDMPFEATIHLLRHTRITRWFELGLDIKEIQYLAGHSNVNMTLQVYTHYQHESRITETAKKIQGVEMYA